jgi:hypothetical protein
MTKDSFRYMCNAYKTYKEAPPMIPGGAVACFVACFVACYLHVTCTDRAKIVKTVAAQLLFYLPVTCT